MRFICRFNDILYEDKYGGSEMLKKKIIRIEKVNAEDSKLLIPKDISIILVDIEEKKEIPTLVFELKAPITKKLKERMNKLMTQTGIMSRIANNTIKKYYYITPDAIVGMNIEDVLRSIVPELERVGRWKHLGGLIKELLSKGRMSSEILLIIEDNLPFITGLDFVKYIRDGKVTKEFLLELLES